MRQEPDPISRFASAVVLEVGRYFERLSASRPFVEETNRLFWRLRVSPFRRDAEEALEHILTAEATLAGNRASDPLFQNLPSQMIVEKAAAAHNETPDALLERMRTNNLSDAERVDQRLMQAMETLTSTAITERHAAYDQAAESLKYYRVLIIKLMMRPSETLSLEEAATLRSIVDTRTTENVHPLPDSTFFPGVAALKKGLKTFGDAQRGHLRAYHEVATRLQQHDTLMSHALNVLAAIQEPLDHMLELFPKPVEDSFRFFMELRSMEKFFQELAKYGLSCSHGWYSQGDGLRLADLDTLLNVVNLPLEDANHPLFQANHHDDFKDAIAAVHAFVDDDHINAMLRAAAAGRHPIISKDLMKYDIPLPDIGPPSGRAR